MNIHIASFFFLVSLSVMGIPMHAESASLSFVRDGGAVSAGDTIIVNAFLHTDSKSVNVIDGTLTYAGAEYGRIKSIVIAKSDFLLWPNKPSVDASGSTISFVGGAPNSVNGSNIPLFQIVIDAQGAGDVTLSGGDVRVYLNDGKGTSEIAQVEPFSLTISQNNGKKIQNEWIDTVEGDSEEPEKFSVEIGRDPSLYDNKYFISFNAVDGGSGIDYYTVQEDALPPVHSSSPYVLQNQNPKQPIIVTAYDNAGNARVATLNKESKFRNPLLLALLAIILYGVVRRYRRNAS